MLHTALHVSTICCSLQAEFSWWMNWPSMPAAVLNAPSTSPLTGTAAGIILEGTIMVRIGTFKAGYLGLGCVIMSNVLYGSTRHNFQGLESSRAEIWWRAHVHVHG